MATQRETECAAHVESDVALARLQADRLGEVLKRINWNAMLLQDASGVDVEVLEDWLAGDTDVPIHTPAPVALAILPDGDYKALANYLIGRTDECPEITEDDELRSLCSSYRRRLVEACRVAGVDMDELVERTGIERSRVDRFDRLYGMEIRAIATALTRDHEESTKLFVLLLGCDRNLVLHEDEFFRIEDELQDAGERFVRGSGSDHDPCHRVVELRERISRTLERATEEGEGGLADLIEFTELTKLVARAGGFSEGATEALEQLRSRCHRREQEPRALPKVAGPPAPHEAETTRSTAPVPMSSKEACQLLLHGDIEEQRELAEVEHDRAVRGYAGVVGRKRDARGLDAFRELEQTGARREYLRGVYDGRVHAIGVFEGAGLIEDD